MNNTNINKLISDALAIEAHEAKEAGALGFMARAMVQATLPHKKVIGNEFERVNGNYRLTMVSPSRIGLPYGTIPRLLLSWLTTEAVKTQSRELVLGDSLSGFMRELDLVATGGQWGSITRLKEQSVRLFATSITAFYQNEQDQSTGLVNRTVADSALLWWDTKTPEQASLWKSSVTLSEPFYSEIINNSVPIDMRAIRALKRSPMALDIYCWLTYRLSYLKSPTEIPWQLLAMQFGSGYSRLDNFKQAFVKELKKVLLVYPEARVEADTHELIIKPSKPHIGRK
jgi:hypothetical protein